MSAPNRPPRRRASDVDQLAVAIGVLRRYLENDPLEAVLDALHPGLPVHPVRLVYEAATAAGYHPVDARALIARALGLHGTEASDRLRLAREQLAALVLAEERP